MNRKIDRAAKMIKGGEFKREAHVYAALGFVITAGEFCVFVMERERNMGVEQYGSKWRDD